VTGDSGTCPQPSDRPADGRESAGLRALPRPVAAVVGGGGVLGAAQVGVGYALEQRGFVPDLIIGTSVGALNGAIAAAHPGMAAPWLDHVWTQLRRRDVFPLGYPSSRVSVFADRGLRRLISRAGLPSRIEQLAVPFTAVAMDLVTGGQALLLTAAVEPAGDMTVLWRAAGRLGIPPDAATPAAEAGLIEFGTRVRGPGTARARAPVRRLRRRRSCGPSQRGGGLGAAGGGAVAVVGYPMSNRSSCFPGTRPISSPLHRAAAAARTAPIRATSASHSGACRWAGDKTMPPSPWRWMYRAASR
jgi:hypothetical protein